MRLSWLVMVTVMIVGGGSIRAADEYPAAGPDVFDWKADGGAQLQAALGESRASGRRVVLMLGANWCPWCHRLDAILRHDPEIAAHWERDYVLVQIDVNWKRPPRRNPGLLARYRRAPQRGIPVLTLLDAGGDILANPDISRWETAEPKDYDVAKLRRFLAEWVPSRPAAPPAGEGASGR